MEQFFEQIEWVPTLVSFIVAFVVGWFWYSPLLFVKKWMQGIGEPVWRAPMWMPMSAQLGSTLFLAIVINLATGHNKWIMATLMVIALAGFVKSNGFYSGKTMYAVSVEVGYIIVMGVIMLITNALI